MGQVGAICRRRHLSRRIEEAYCFWSCRYILFRTRPDYLLRVVGRSIIGEGIHDGDLVAVKTTPVARHGQLVVARIAGDSFTIEKLFEKDGVICLLPNSPGYCRSRWIPLKTSRSKACMPA